MPVCVAYVGGADSLYVMYPYQSTVHDSYVCQVIFNYIKA